MFRYSDIITTLKIDIPEFKFDSFFEESPILVLGQFALFVNKEVEGHHMELLNRCAKFLDIMASSDDIDVLPSVCEFAYELKSISTKNYNKFLDLVSGKTASFMNEENEVWQKNNRPKKL